MVARQKSDKTRDLLPWYLNESLSQEERREVEAYLSQSAEREQALLALQEVQKAVMGQANASPSPSLKTQLLRRVQRQPDPRWGWLSWSLGAMLSLLVLLILWGILQPGIVLQWSVQDGSLASYRVYRAPVGSEDYTLVEEISAQADMNEYVYTDPRVWPGQDAVYVVEGIGQDGSRLTSQSVIGSAAAVLPSQLAILFASLVMGYGVYLLAVSRRPLTLSIL